MADAMRLDATVCTNINSARLSQEQVDTLVDQIVCSYQVPPAVVITATWLLFLMGAAIKSVPETKYVAMIVAGRPGGAFVFSKRDLVYYYQKVFGNPYVRRLAEFWAVAIGEYATKNGLDGDIAPKLNNQSVSSNKGALTQRERGFASSFSQHIPNIGNILSDRLAQLLADDSTQRFSKNQKSNQKGLAAPAVKKGNKPASGKKTKAREPKKGSKK